MQNKYFGDIHDFYKFYFFKEITKDYSLGIHWCLIPNQFNRNDGNKTLSSKEAQKDPSLYKLLTTCKDRDVKYIKSYFPKNTKYFDRLHEDYSMDLIYEDESIAKLQNQEVIFFDPDNGIEVPSTNNINRYKFVSYRLLLKFWKLGKSLIIYQHGSRIKGQTDEKIRILYNLIGKTANVITVKKGNVTYICFIQRKHYILFPRE